MKATDAFANLLRFGARVLTTDDVAVRLRVSISGATRILSRLAASGLVLPLRRGLWSLDPKLDPLVLVEYLTRPLPAYVSLQSALHLHGMISQIPRTIYVASLARTRTVKTLIGTYSIHQLSPSFFGGYELVGEGDRQIKLATPEKALVDVLYLRNVRSRLFARLPELEFPPRFDVREARRWVKRIASGSRRVMVNQGLEAILAAQRLEPLRRQRSRQK